MLRLGLRRSRLSAVQPKLATVLLALLSCAGSSFGEPPIWREGALGESCASTCEAVGGSCVSDYPAVQTASMMDEIAAKIGTTCGGRHDSDSSPENPCLWYGGSSPTCYAQSSSSHTVSCTGRNSKARRFCPCTRGTHDCGDPAADDFVEGGAAPGDNQLCQYSCTKLYERFGLTQSSSSSRCFNAADSHNIHGAYWVYGDPVKSCTDTCRNEGYTCLSGTWPTLSEADFKTISGVTCSSYNSGGASTNPEITGTSCYYDGASSCSGTETGSRRLCPCVSPNGEHTSWPPGPANGSNHTYTIPVWAGITGVVIQGRASGADGSARTLLSSRVDAIGTGVKLVMRHVNMSGLVAVAQPADHSYVDGGAVHVLGGTLVLEYSTFHRNVARCGGALAVYGSGATVTIVGCTFELNRADLSSGSSRCSHDGGAITVYGGARATISGSTFRNNTATRGGAVYLHSNTGAISINDCVYLNNTAQGDVRKRDLLPRCTTLSLHVASGFLTSCTLSGRILLWYNRMAVRYTPRATVLT
eukprot:COSAG02_NODE_818_length_16813_cov_137.642874_5_plen_530_part_00